MKKLIMLVVLLFGLTLTGCEEAESKKETKETTKKTYEIPRGLSSNNNMIIDKSSNNNEGTEKTSDQIKSEQKYTTTNICSICKCEDLEINLGHLHGIGYVHESCYNNYPKCYNCENSLFYFDDDNNGYCNTCDAHTYCMNCGVQIDPVEGDLCTSCLHEANMNLYKETYNIYSCPSCGSMATEDYAGKTCMDCGQNIYVK